MDEAQEALADLLRSAGLRVTAPRLAVLSALAERPHADAEWVIRRVRSELANAAPGAPGRDGGRGRSLGGGQGPRGSVA